MDCVLSTCIIHTCGRIYWNVSQVYGTFWAIEKCVFFIDEGWFGGRISKKTPFHLQRSFYQCLH